MTLSTYKLRHYTPGLPCQGLPFSTNSILFFLCPGGPTYTPSLDVPLSSHTLDTSHLPSLLKFVGIPFNPLILIFFVTIKASSKPVLWSEETVVWGFAVFNGNFAIGRLDIFHF